MIQRADQPIILTGYQALNKLLGRPVYSSQLQLGGPRVMAQNGVSHLTALDDLHGAKQILTWLSFVPTRVSPSLASDLPTIATSDPITRAVTYAAPLGRKFNARDAITGCLAGAGIPQGNADAPASSSASAAGGSHIAGVNEGYGGSGHPAAYAGDAHGWQTGLFDKGSWVESQPLWARTVIVGRARLGGVPVGVVAVESESVMLSVPADPGMPDSSEQTILQAGQVRSLLLLLY